MSDDDAGRSASLSQVQIIRSLAEALAWFEKELQWGVDPGELRHLTGRIGELYTAMITRGQMALAVNQRGYDVVAADGQRISVKTVTSSSQVTFRRSTVDQADRIVILRINIDDGEASIEEVANEPAPDILLRCSIAADEYRFGLRSRPAEPADLSRLKVVASAVAGHCTIKQFENGTIFVEENGVRVPKVKPILREMAVALGVSLLNGSGGIKNTRQLGSDIIKTLRD